MVGREVERCSPGDRCSLVDVDGADGVDCANGVDGIVHSALVKRASPRLCFFYSTNDLSDDLSVCQSVCQSAGQSVKLSWMGNGLRL